MVGTIALETIALIVLALVEIMKNPRNELTDDRYSMYHHAIRPSWPEIRALG
jgi:hypothetical protein